MAQVLVVDDHPSNRDLVTTLLGYAGHTFFEASNGAEALALARSKRPDLVICDILMPGMDGFEFVRQLRADPDIARTHVVFYTATFMEAEAKALAHSCGVSLVLTKPCEPQDILETVARALNADEVTDSVPDPDAFDREHLRLLTDKLVIKANELEAANQRLSALTGLNLDLASERDPYTLLAKVCRGARELLGSRVAVLRARQKNGLESVNFSTEGLDPTEAARLEQVAIDAGPLGEAMLQRRALRFSNPSGEPVAAGFSAEYPVMHSALLAPIVSLNHAYGTILLIDKVGAAEFTDEEERILAIYAAQAGRIYENGSLYLAMKRSAAQQAQLHEALQQAYDDLRQSQQTVMQQERLRALGQMASGIAHDINNAISPVALYTERLLEREPNLSERGRGYLVTIARAIDDVAATVARMREFYRQREPQLVLVGVQLNTLVQQVVDLTHARWSDMPQHRGVVIRLVVDPMPELPEVLGVESEVREALTNLVFNAVDAMPEGGVLTLRTSCGGPSVHGGEAERRYAQIEVGDTGAGMDEETQRRCLEPFFTTKGERGTGLGLAMVYGTMQRHGAEVEIDSAIGRGTTVRLRFPIPTTVPSSESASPLPQAPAARLRILIVDDDPLMLKSLGDTLEMDGHVVVASNGGQAGIDAFKAACGSAQAFDVVITDLGMPYVDGRKVAVAIKEASAATPIILFTGWGQQLLAEGDVPVHVDRVLSKPPKLRELRAALAEVVSRGKASG